jgi:hypothetical protein
MLKMLLAFLAFSITVFACHFIITENFIAGQFFYPLWQIYAFLFVATAIILLLLRLIHRHFPDKTGFLFMALSILKMAFSVVFFLPLMKADVADPVGDVLNFFIPYFLFLTFEAVAAVRLINSR